MCGCNGKTNQATASPEEMQAAADARREEAQQIREQSRQSQQNALVNASR